MAVVAPPPVEGGWQYRLLVGKQRFQDLRGSSAALPPRGQAALPGITEGVAAHLLVGEAALPGFARYTTIRYSFASAAKMGYCRDRGAQLMLPLSRDCASQDTSRGSTQGMQVLYLQHRRSISPQIKHHGDIMLEKTKL